MVTSRASFGTGNNEHGAAPLATFNPDEASVAMFKAGYNFAKKHYVLTSVYALGLIIAQLATGFAVSAVTRTSFEQSLEKVAINEAILAEEAERIAYDDYRNSKGWFSCDQVCTDNYAFYQTTVQKLEAVRAKNAAALSEARAKVGIFSEFGVSDARNMFWNAFERGRGFASRSSWYDALFLSIRAMGRDDSLTSVFINWLLHVAMNFTIGMVGTFISFAWHVVGLVISYQSNPLSAFTFVGLSMAGGFAIIASMVVGLYFAAASTAFVTLKVLGPNLRIAFEDRAGRGLNARIQRNAHYE